MRKTIIVIASLLTLILIGYIGMYIWIDGDVKKNIEIAKTKYEGIAEDALIAYLLDTSNSTRSRSTIAIWTLGHIKSEKALPILKELYKNDPEGKTCKGKHQYVLCQNEIYNAIKSIESKWVPLHKRLNK